MLVFGAIGWVVAANNPDAGFALWMGGMIGTLVLGLVIAFKKTLSVPLILLYAVVEGLFLGAVSQFFTLYFDEPAPRPSRASSAQAVIATLATFAGMFLAYKFGLIKVTAAFRRVMTMMIFGYALFAIVNFIFAMVGATRRSASAAAVASASRSRVRGRPGVVHPRARLRLDRAGDRQRCPAEVLVAPRARPDRHPGLALHRVPPPVRPSASVTEHRTTDTAGAGSPAPAVSSAVPGAAGAGADVVAPEARVELDRIRRRWAELPLDRAEARMPVLRRLLADLAPRSTH